MATGEEATHIPLTADEEAFLRALSRVMQTLPRALDADLIRARGMSLSDYTALMYLSEAPGRRLRMSELANASASSLSGLTRIVDRLEREGFVDRQQSCDDGRSWNAVLTEAGLERLRQAWPAHLESVRRHVFDYLTDIDVGAVAAALQHVASDTARSDPLGRRNTVQPIPIGT